MRKNRLNKYRSLLQKRQNKIGDMICSVIFNSNLKRFMSDPSYRAELRERELLQYPEEVTG